MDIKEMYWNRNGQEQAKYEELQAAIDAGEWNLSQKTDRVFYSYYRYFNDGDFPGWAKGNWNIRRYGRWGWELNELGLEQQELRVTEAILAEYKRFEKSKKAVKR